MFRGSHSGRGRGGGRGRQYRGGRPPIQPFVEKEWKSSAGEIKLFLTDVELEALKLIDKENLTQEQAAERMRISRGTFWRILQEARQKIILALTSGKTNIHLTKNNPEAKE
jgi:predicted DNA-binding protein (UPF0251 family)